MNEVLALLILLTVVGQRDIAIGAGHHVAALGTLDVGGEATTVQQQNHLAAVAQGAFHGLMKRSADRATRQAVLRFDPQVDASPFMPRWAVTLSTPSGEVSTDVSQSHDLNGDSDGDGIADSDEGSGDTDGDGIPDSRDECPRLPEDIDGFQDEDGCPDPDNDADGVLDVNDGAPMDPEDIDGFQDEDGCPDNDRDRDGVPDDVDNCIFTINPGQADADVHGP